jgi:death-on-curing protein
VTAEPRFLTFAQVVRIHQDQLAQYGGQDGIRDVGLLESAIAQPQASFSGQYLHGDLAAMAAAYLFHVVRNHPFIDGNKRVATMCAYVFLHFNGLRLDADEDAFEAIVLQAACGERDAAALAAFIRGWIWTSM